MNKTVFLVVSLLSVSAQCKAGIKESLRQFLRPKGDMKVPGELPGRFEPDHSTNRLRVKIWVLNSDGKWVPRFQVVEGIPYDQAVNRGYFGGNVWPVE